MECFVRYVLLVGGWGTVTWYHPSSYTVPDRLAEELSQGETVD